MNILVTVPKSEVEHFWEEPASSGGCECWKLSGLPLRTKPGEYIYFAIGGKIVARAPIADMGVMTFVCDTTGRRWSGPHILWKATEFERVSAPGRFPALRGFCYLEKKVERRTEVQHAD